MKDYRYVDEWLAHNIIDTFETFLEVRNIKIDNPEKREAIDAGDDPETIAIIYGSDYDNLYDTIRCTAERYRKKLDATKIPNCYK